MHQKPLTALLLLLLLLGRQSISVAQVKSDTSTVNVPRLVVMGTAFTAGYTAMLVSLNKSWYSENRTDFHFFNDNSQWKQVDKAGHFWGAFHESRSGIDMLRWAGMAENKAILLGGLTGMMLQTPIEVFDGYQPGYGASAGDLIANTAGSAAVVAQELAWNEVRLMPKYSFRTTRFAAVRPGVLGDNLAEQALKDYNGQTYWLSVDVGAFLKQEIKYPRWLNIAVGYGAEEVVYNPEETNRANGFSSYRQYYISPDLNLMHFKGRSKFLNTALYVLSIVKIPAPALEYNRKNGLRLHALYF
ncbi:DUF2279 domain-containing protein [Pontibacter toksunensis]|uniref:DUF2279 domain-containing protein n=1 Tax=Pontibacter toksunensis TaxID=1332631 RepID=A0ABW6BMH7_9BACT